MYPQDDCQAFVSGEDRFLTISHHFPLEKKHLIKAPLN